MRRRGLDGLLLRLYPAQWRARYGEELAALMLDSSDNQHTPWRIRGNVVFAALRERLQATGLIGNEVPPPERARAGALLVLCGWTLFVVAGMGVSKFSEHWQDATPASTRALPSAAFEGLMIAAAIGTLLVAGAIVAAFPSLIRFVRNGGWPQIRRRVLRAAILSGLTIGATIALAAWAHRLNVDQRNGGDPVYSIAFVIWAVAATACLIGWTTAAIATARRLHLSVVVLRLDAWIASAVCITMVAMTAATLTWWIALGESAPWVLSGRADGTTGGFLSSQLFAYTILMLTGSLLGAIGATKALRALPGLDTPS